MGMSPHSWSVLGDDFDDAVGTEIRSGVQVAVLCLLTTNGSVGS